MTSSWSPPTAVLTVGAGAPGFVAVEVLNEWISLPLAQLPRELEILRAIARGESNSRLSTAASSTLPNRPKIHKIHPAQLNVASRVQAPLLSRDQRRHTSNDGTRRHRRAGLGAKPKRMP